jgi:hypothetical protein
MVAILFAFIGFYAGAYFGDFFGQAVLGGVILAVLLSVAALPLMKFATGVTVALATAALAGYLWQMSDMPEKYTLLCMIAGLILGGFGGYYILIFAVMAYTSLLGASVVLTGLSGFFRHVLPPEHTASANGIEESIGVSLNLPIIPLLLLLTAAGVLIQMHIHHIPNGEPKENKS